MNLGDGLLFELEDGKPRLILLNHAGIGKNPVKLPSRHRAANILGAGQSDVQQEERPPPQVVRSRREARFKVGAAAPSCDSSIATADRRSTVMTSSKVPVHHRERGNKAVAKTLPLKMKTNKHKLSATVRPLGSSRRLGPPPNAEDGGAGLELVDVGLKDGVACLTSEQLRQILSNLHTSSSSGQLGPEEQALQGGQTTTNFASSANEREETEIKEDGDELRVEEKKDGGTEEKHGRLPSSFSWLDEHQSDSRATIHAKRAQWKRELDEQVALKKQLQHSAPSRLQGAEYLESVSPVGHREQPAAIRSSLQLGEEVLSVERKEEQRRRWLEELDRQRVETAERRKREEQLRRQTEDHERWAAHFDSLQRRAPIHPPGQLSRCEQEDLDPSSSLSLVWEATSSCGAESVIGASVDSTRGLPSRSSYLRTMTSLLDPAQIEERERRRLKQLEQQRAIDAQMDERRKQREQEEARRRQEEEEEEKRVALEREKQQKQYELERLKKKKDPVPQEEQPEDSRPEDTSEPRAVTRLAGCVENGFSSLPFYKDSSVQTEDTTPPPPLPLAADRVQTPDVSVENHTPPPDSAEPPNSSSRAARAEKKNISLPAGEDQYELFARSERSRRTKTRPEWNTQRPSRRFVPASERYPVALQKNRQESRLRRQAELLALQERTRLTRTEPTPQNQEARLCPNSQQTRTNPVKKVDSSFRGQNHHHTATNADRGRSPPVPAIKPEVESQPTSSSPPLALEFIPYLRTAEVFSLNPLEPSDTPPPRTHPGPPPPTESSASSRDPLLHPEVLHNSQRQQEILRGLAQLRQGLLQKQRELETDLNRRDNGQRTASSALRTADGGGVRSTAQLIDAAK